MVDAHTDIMNSEKSEHHAWALLLAARERLDRKPDRSEYVFSYHETSCQVTTESAGEVSADLHVDDKNRWVIGSHLNQTIVQLLEFYLPVLGNPADCSQVIAHLGQSVDAQIATDSGDAFFVTGDENRKHLHRLRGLCHAVIVGAKTIIADDPRLTTRAVSGQNPVRVVIDPDVRLPISTGVFNDQASQTLVLFDERIAIEDPAILPESSDSLEYIPLQFVNRTLPAATVIEALANRGLTRVFVEGGGVTVSHFLNQGCVDRLQIATAPVLVGKGRAALQLPGVDCMANAIRPPYRLYRMGDDVLWDFDVSEQGALRQTKVIVADRSTPAEGPVFARLR